MLASTYLPRVDASQGRLSQDLSVQVPSALRCFQPKADPPLAETAASAPHFYYLKLLKLGTDLLSQDLSVQVPSALQGLTAEFGMESGVSPALQAPRFKGSKKCGIATDTSIQTAKVCKPRNIPWIIRGKDFQTNTQFMLHSTK